MIVREVLPEVANRDGEAVLAVADVQPCVGPLARIGFHAVQKRPRSLEPQRDPALVRHVVPVEPVLSARRVLIDAALAGQHHAIENVRGTVAD